MLQAVMASVVYETVICLLLLVAVRGTSVQPKKIIYVDKVNGTLEPSFWQDKTEFSSIEVTLNGVELSNSTLVAVKHESKHDKVQESTAAVSHDQQCPTWFFPDPPSNGSCRCGNDVQDTVRCKNSTKEAAILNCYCMTYNKSTGPVVGACFYNCMNPTLKNELHRFHELHHLLPSNITELNNYMCGYFNREGQLCGRCKENYSIPVYSYDLNCVQCSASPFNWVKYILAAFLPLTVFFVLVVSCRLSATSPKLLAFVFFSQSFAKGDNVRAMLEVTKLYPILTKFARVVLALYGIWNLDFFRTLLPHICVNVGTLQALALDYAVAFYPLILLVVTYMVIQVHACNFRVIRVMCRPFHRWTERFRNQWDVRTSIVEAFATFLLLSYLKLLSVSFDFLTPTQVYNGNGTLVGLYLFYDATIEYFGDEHLPYGVLAVFVLLVFILFPLLLLLLYPMRCFQRCLGCCGVRWHALPIFIDAFQGCYKDGTNGTRDCRYFAAAFLIARILLCVVFSLNQTGMFYVAGLFVFLALAMAIVIVKPYKPRFSTYNAVDSVLVLIMALWCATAVCIIIAGLESHSWLKFSVPLAFTVALLPLFYISFVTLHWMCSRRHHGRRVMRKVCEWIGVRHRQMGAAGSEEFLPDRLIHPDEYEEDLMDPVAVQVEENLSDNLNANEEFKTAY